MFKVYKKEIEVAGKKISLETGKVARQADGAIIAKLICVLFFPKIKKVLKMRTFYFEKFLMRPH